MQYTVIFEHTGQNYAAYSPDVPLCFTTGTTLEATKRSIVEALAFHFEGLREAGLAIPEPATRPEEVTDLPAGAQVDVVDVELPSPARFYG